MSLAVGARLGAYEILAPLGTGGMGEVYKARDPRLNRVVAIKVLPRAAAADLERRARFEREAQAIAALNHPNIVTIHAVEEAEGVPFFTMEYVDGRTLAQMIPPHGLPLDELLRIAIPLTDAVGAAHQRGILHRDLKPANVMVTSDGRVKVLDFGLAKLREALIHEDGGAQTTAESTGEGRIVGTVAYMSPEQAEGKPLDQRSDIFSLGILMYEMTTGQRPFKGDTSVSVLSAILKDTPSSVTDLRPDLPRDLAKLLRRALTKDPEHRYQSAKDLRNDLESLKEDLDSGELARAGVQRPIPGLVGRHPRLAAGAVIAVVVLVAAGGWWGSRLIAPTQPSQAPARPFDEFTLKQLTTEDISERTAAISPDGRYIAYAFVEQGREGLRIRQVEASATVQVVPPAEVQYYYVTFTPDGNRLLYTTYPKGSGTAILYEVAVLGGTPRRLIEDVDGGVTFEPGAARLAFMRGLPNVGVALVIANADGTGERALVTRQKPFVLTAGAWSPDGRTIATAAFDEGSKLAVFMVDAATGTTSPVGARRWDEVESLAWERDGRALVVAAMDRSVASSTQLWEIAVPGGAVRRITKDIAGYHRVSLAADGRTLVALRSEWRGTLWAGASAQPDRVARIGAVPNRVSRWRIRWTPDGRLLYTASVSGNPDVWTVRPDGSDLRQLTTSPDLDAWAMAAPDNRCIVFLSDRDARDRIWRMEPDGGRQAPLTDGPVDYSPVVAPDSRSVYFARREQPSAVYAVPIDGGVPTLMSGPPSASAPGKWAGLPIGFWPAALSPDGRQLAGTYWDMQQGRIRVAVVPLDGRGGVRTLDIPLPVESEESFAWAPDGRAITFVRTTDGAVNLWRQPLDGGPAVQLTHYTSGEDIVSHAWSDDGKWLALLRGTAESHIVLIRDVGRGR
jgi:eukaryotic-like serine/threonine-protein kinase